MIKKRFTLITIAALFLLIAATGIWKNYIATTRVAFLNYQVISLNEISKANNNKMIEIVSYKPSDIDHMKFDLLFINGMGLHITEAQREQLNKMIENGKKIITVMATNPANNLCSLDDTDADTLLAYNTNGGRQNSESMLNYIRRDIDKKWYSAPQALPVMKAAYTKFYHPDLDNLDNEVINFEYVETLNKYLNSHKKFDAKAPRIIITGQMGIPDTLMLALEATGNMTYGVRNMRSLIASTQIDSINPAAVINMAHGRLGDKIVSYLKKKNIPLFSPLNINMQVKKWEEDKMGMSGGFMSQSIVMPEIDGALRPYVIFGHYMKNGLPYAAAIPNRLKKFVTTVNNYINLKSKPNAEKKIAIYYYKGPGLATLTAGGMDVKHSLYNILKQLKKQGYNFKIPVSANALYSKIQNIDTTGVPRVELGNIVLLPQLAPAKKGSHYTIVHGAKTPPPTDYINSYNWVRNTFNADALIHIGTHGSLEFTPAKQVALCDTDWPDSLIGTVPHFYIYCIDDPGEAMIAKRRTYAGIQTYLTPPFMGTQLKGEYNNLHDAIHKYNHAQTPTNAKIITKLVQKKGLWRDLEIEENPKNNIYSEEEYQRIEHYVEEMVHSNIPGNLYTMGQSYEKDKLFTTLRAMTTAPIAYALMALDKERGVIAQDFEKHMSAFNRQYLIPAEDIVEKLLKSGKEPSNKEIAKILHLSPTELNLAIKIDSMMKAPTDFMGIMKKRGMAMMKTQKGTKSSMHEGMKEKYKGMKIPPKMLAAMKKKAAEKKATQKKIAAKDTIKQTKTAKHASVITYENPSYSKSQKQWARTVMTAITTLKNVQLYRQYIIQSPNIEMSSLINALQGGYTQPAPGGDPIANPNSLPTGRNMYAINAEATPTERAWEEGKKLANNTIELYKKKHGKYPRKVSFTLWSSEFIQTEGASIAQALFLLGVEPIRDMFGRVNDIRLIPEDKLGRPRIDVVVQTSGQLRDLAASRLFLINRAVEMAAHAKADKYENEVAEGVKESERLLVEKGVSPKEAREISTYRVFGAADGSYGTGIQNMVQAGDKWDSNNEIARVYMNNMGGFYGSKKDWERTRKEAFRAALTRTDVVTQPRQSNTWGVLSLDHVYEFMGGMNLAIRNVTGKEPDAYVIDYRNSHNTRMQELKEAIGIESKTTVLNPAYIKERMKGDGESANIFAEVMENTYGWNVMKPSAIDNELWDAYYDVIIMDKHKLGLQQFFDKKNPAAIQEMTAVMLETARKGMWKTDEEHLNNLANIHLKSITKHGLSASSKDYRNQKLQSFIKKQLKDTDAKQYQKDINKALNISDKSSKKNGMVMKKEEMNTETKDYKLSVNNIAIGSLILIALGGVILLIRRRRANKEE